MLDYDKDTQVCDSFRHFIFPIFGSNEVNYNAAEQRCFLQGLHLLEKSLFIVAVTADPAADEKIGMRVNRHSGQYR